MLWLVLFFVGFTQSEGCAGDEQFVIIATDGVWDNLQPRVAANIVREALHHNLSLDVVARALVEESLARRRSDNVTAVVIAFSEGEQSKTSGSSGIISTCTSNLYSSSCEYTTS